jgi:uncharacterized protein YggT (Ycf19 family)
VDLTRLLKSFKGAKRFWRHGPSGPGLSPIQRLVKSQGCIDFKIFVIIFIIKPFEPSLNLGENILLTINE